MPTVYFLCLCLLHWLMMFFTFALSSAALSVCVLHYLCVLLQCS
jgi:hypothetical protein